MNEREYGIVSKLPPQHTSKYTLLGYSALVLWSFSAACAATLKTLPSFQVVTTTFFMAFLYCAFRIHTTKQWHKLKQPWYVWLVGVVGLSGQQILYILAFKYAPPVQADLVIYTWPIMVVLMSHFLKKRKNFKRTLVATLLGFFGVSLLFIAEPESTVPFTPLVGLGYALAFLCALVWSMYTVVSRRFKKAPSEIVGFYGLIGSMICLPLHLTFEESVMPSLFQWGVLTFMGVGITGLAYYFWDKGIKKGNFQLLSILSYTNPILSIGWLCVFGLDDLHSIIIVSALLIIFGAFWGGVTQKQWRFFKAGISHVPLFWRLIDARSTKTVIRQQKVDRADRRTYRKKKSFRVRNALAKRHKLIIKARMKRAK